VADPGRAPHQQEPRPRSATRSYSGIACGAAFSSRPCQKITWSIFTLPKASPENASPARTDDNVKSPKAQRLARKGDARFQRVKDKALHLGQANALRSRRGDRSSLGRAREFAKPIDLSFLRYLLFKILAQRTAELNTGRAPRGLRSSCAWLGRYRAPPSVAREHVPWPRRPSLHEIVTGLLPRETDPESNLEIIADPFTLWRQPSRVQSIHLFARDAAADTKAS
jgi:hypothetical protein